MEKTLAINIERLMNNMQALSQFGQNPGGGIDRALGSMADEEARNWLINYWKENLSLPVRMDAIANLWADYQGKQEGSAIVIGSHHDAVPDGGKYDGALGVLMATEIVETLKEHHMELNHPVSIVSFTGEEPNPYNVSTLGSKVVSGRLTQKDLVTYSSRLNGESLEDRIRRLGGDIHQAANALLDEDKVSAFLECHIEQGKRLERAGISVSAVNCITGIHREMYTVLGEANHAGTTVMSERKDAMLAGAQLSLCLEQIAKSFEDNDVVATVGYYQIEPNEANIIPGKVTCIADIRTYKPEILAEFTQKIKDAITMIEKERGVAIHREIILDQMHVPMDPVVIESVEAGIAQMGEVPVQLVSMAGHDAANMALVTKSGMIFVQSVDGKSHCKEEYTREEDIEKMGNAMLLTLLHLDHRLAQ